MKCPLFTTSSIDKGGMIDYKRWECLKEECSWWDTTRRACAVEHLSYSLRIVAEELVDIRHKMPHSGQFTK